MKILIMFILNELIMKICGSVDTAFGNSLGIDSVCVLAAFTVIKWFFDNVTALGKNSYYVALKDAKLCLLLNVFSGIVTGIIIFALHNVIPYLYQLTDSQYSLFKRCLVVYSIEAVTHSVSEFLYVYLLYSNNMKMVYGTNAFYYALLILTDWVVVRNGWDLSALLCCTAVCNVAYSILIFAISDFRKTKSSYSMTGALDLAKHGFDIMFDRVTGKVATLFFQCFASKLGTEMFAIHGVCYAVSVLMESYTNGLYTFTVNRLSKVHGIVGKYNAHLWIIKHYGPLVLSLVAVSIMPGLFLLHGSVPVASCISFVFVYCLHTVSLVMYETSGACLISMQKTSILKFDGIVGIAIRIPAVLLLYWLGLGLIGFAISTILDFAGRGLYNEIRLRSVLSSVE